MLLSLLYQLVRYLTDLALVRTQSDAQLRAEVLALRHQLRVSGAEDRQASLAARRSPPARRLAPAIAASELGCPATQTGDPAPLAPRAGPSQVGRLCRTPTTARFCSASRATGAGLEARSGEPILGLPTHPG